MESRKMVLISLFAKEMHTETTDLRNQWGKERVG